MHWYSSTVLLVYTYGSCTVEYWQKQCCVCSDTGKHLWLYIAYMYAGLIIGHCIIGVFMDVWYLLIIYKWLLFYRSAVYLTIAPALNSSFQGGILTSPVINVSEGNRCTGNGWNVPVFLFMSFQERLQINELTYSGVSFASLVYHTILH